MGNNMMELCHYSIVCPIEVLGFHTSECQYYCLVGWHCVVWCIGANVYEVPVASIFMVEEWVLLCLEIELLGEKPGL